MKGDPKFMNQKQHELESLYRNFVRIGKMTKFKGIISLI